MFLDLYSNDFRKRNQGHFASMVRVALSDCVISEEEKIFLDKIAHKLEITEGRYQHILENADSYPINLPASHQERIERLYDLSRMVCIENIDAKAKQTLLGKFVIALGFEINDENRNLCVKETLKLANANVTFEEFETQFNKVK